MKKRVFTSFAVPEDTAARTLLVGQSRNASTPFDLIDYSVKKPWDSAWKTECRARIRSCRGFIVMLSAATANAPGACWEIKCAVEEGLPVLGVRVPNKAQGVLPAEMRGQRVVDWTHANLAAFINAL